MLLDGKHLLKPEKKFNNKKIKGKRFTTVC